MAYLEIQNASKIIKKKQIFSDIQMSINQGEIVGLVGHNGSGKTMLMKAILGMIRLTSGQISMDNQLVTFNERLPVMVGTIIENPDFIPYYTGWQNLIYLASLNQNVDEARILTYMQHMGIEFAKDTKVAHYSLGMKQKLAIVQAVMEDQPLLLLDEPTNGLDKEALNQFIPLMTQMKQAGKTILIASHDDHVISAVTDRLYHISNGRIVEGS